MNKALIILALITASQVWGHEGDDCNSHTHHGNGIISSTLLMCGPNADIDLTVPGKLPSLNSKTNKAVTLAASNSVPVTTNWTGKYIYPKSKTWTNEDGFAQEEWLAVEAGVVTGGGVVWRVKE